MLLLGVIGNYHILALHLENSVLADPTTVSNIGIILGALIASALSGKISKFSTINKKLILAAMYLEVCLWVTEQD